METEQEIADRKWVRFTEERAKYCLAYTPYDAYIRGYEDGRASKNINLQIADWLMDVSAKHEGEPGASHLTELANVIRVFARALSDKGEEGRDAILTFQRSKGTSVNA